MKKQSIIYLIILIFLFGCNTQDFTSDSAIDSEKKIIKYHEKKFKTILYDTVKLGSSSIEMSMKINHLAAKDENCAVENYEISAVNVFVTTEDLTKEKVAAINSVAYNYFKNITVSKNINVVIKEIPKDPEELKKNNEN